MSPQNVPDGTGDGPPFECRWRAEGAGAASVQVSGEVDMLTAPQMNHVLRDACAQAPLVVLDLSAVSFIDSSGLHVLVDAAGRARESGTRMVMIGASRALESLLVLTGTQHLINALPSLSRHGVESLLQERASIQAPEAGFDPLANPVNASVLAGRVMAISDDRLWLHAPDGTILRAWAPYASGLPVPAGEWVEIYLDREGAVNGWRHAASGISINQRQLPPGAKPDTAAPLTCRGSCRVTWMAPAALQLTEHDERCLTCAGPLVRA